MIRKIFKGGRGATWVVLLVVLLATSPARPATKAVDLDGNGTTESSVVLNVVQTWPPKIQNKVINNSGAERIFNWLNAGPGGFSSRVGIGELRWTWETAVTIYSYTGTVCRNDMCTVDREGAPLGGAFKVPGRTVTQGQITTSTASLTSSLVQSFSPGVMLVECTSSVEQLANGNFGYTVTCTNGGGDPVVIEIPAGPEGCCEEEDQLSCPVEILLESGDLAVATECVDYLEDPNNCGGCGNECDEGEVCVDGYCEIECSDEWILCEGEGSYCIRGGCDCPFEEGTWLYACYDDAKGGFGGYCPDFDTDEDNCGGCGNFCYEDEECLNGQCVLDCDMYETLCEGEGYYCADLNSDEYNCGQCGFYCEETHQCDDGECVQTCDEGDCGEFCDGEGDCYGGECYCGEGSAFTGPGSSMTRQAAPAPKPTHRAAAPKAPGSATALPKCGVPAAPLCDTPGQQIVIPPGGSYSECFASPFLAQEILGTFRGCGGSIPDGNPLCDGALGSQGPFEQLAPLPGALPGAGYLNVVGFQMTDASGNGLIEPGERVCFKVEVVNSGSSDLTGVKGTLVSPPVDLTCGEIAEDECVPEGDDPASVTILNGFSKWPMLAGVEQVDPGDTTCDVGPAMPEGKTNLVEFCVRFPSTHPGDVARPFELLFTGYGGFSQTVPFSLAVGDFCDLTEDDFPDLLSGMLSPVKAKLLPVDQPVSYQLAPIKRKQTVPLQLALYCGGSPVGTSETPFAPRILKLVGQDSGEIDPAVVDLSFAPVPFNSFFESQGRGKWRFNLRTHNLAPDTYVLTIRINDVKDYHFGFTLK